MTFPAQSTFHHISDNRQLKALWPHRWLSVHWQCCLQKNARKLALLNACFAFFKYTIRILLSKEACYIIVFIINALWFVWLCVCNRPKQRSHLFCWQKLICTRIFLLFSAETAFLSLEIGLAKSFTFIIFKVLC